MLPRTCLNLELRPRAASGAPQDVEEPVKISEDSQLAVKAEPVDELAVKPEELSAVECDVRKTLSAELVESQTVEVTEQSEIQVLSSVAQSQETVTTEVVDESKQIVASSTETTSETRVEVSELGIAQSDERIETLAQPSTELSEPSTMPSVELQVVAQVEPAEELAVKPEELSAVECDVRKTLSAELVESQTVEVTEQSEIQVLSSVAQSQETVTTEVVDESKQIVASSTETTSETRVEVSELGIAQSDERIETLAQPSTELNEPSTMPSVELQVVAQVEPAEELAVKPEELSAVECDVRKTLSAELVESQTVEVTEQSEIQVLSSVAQSQETVTTEVVDESKQIVASSTETTSETRVEVSELGIAQSDERIETLAQPSTELSEPSTLPSVELLEPATASAVEQNILSAEQSVKQIESVVTDAEESKSVLLASVELSTMLAVEQRVENAMSEESETNREFTVGKCEQLVVKSAEQKAESVKVVDIEQSDVTVTVPAEQSAIAIHLEGNVDLAVSGECTKTVEISSEEMVAHKIEEASAASSELLQSITDITQQQTSDEVFVETSADRQSVEQQSINAAVSQTHHQRKASSVVSTDEYESSIALSCCQSEISLSSGSSKPCFIRKLPSRVEITEGRSFTLHCRTSGAGCKPWFVKKLPARIDVERGNRVDLECIIGNWSEEFMELGSSSSVRSLEHKKKRSSHGERCSVIILCCTSSLK
jgi:hypothetical protein